MTTAAALSQDNQKVEALPFEAVSLDGVLLSCLVHHLPDLHRCIAENIPRTHARCPLRGV
jgi:Methyltransferase domain